MIQRWGVPYQGSKNGIAEWVVQHLPEAENLYDLFAGGCAVTHCAMVKEKYKHYHINDLNPFGVTLFKDAVEGKFIGETRWISREEFNKEKGRDPFIAICWSFGGNMEDYLYSKEIVHWKKAVHYARVFGDYSLLREFGVYGDGSRKDIREHFEEYKERYKNWYLKNVLKMEVGFEEDREKFIERNSRASDETFQNDEPYNRVLRIQNIQDTIKSQQLQEEVCLGKLCASSKSYQNVESYNRILRIQNIHKHQSLQNTERCQQLQGKVDVERLEVSSKSYQEVEVKPHSVIYCDIPYKGTMGYSGVPKLDYDEFYTWCSVQREPVVVSSYKMPDCFERIASREKPCKFSILGSSGKVEEGLFVHREQIRRGIFKRRKKAEGRMQGYQLRFSEFCRM